MKQFLFPNYEWIEGRNGWVEKLKENTEEENSYLVLEKIAVMQKKKIAWNCFFRIN